MILWLLYSILAFVMRHGIYYRSHNNFYYINGIGFVILALLSFPIGSGILLSMIYSNTSLTSFNSFIYIRLDTNFGWFISFSHALLAGFYLTAMFYHYTKSMWLQYTFILEWRNQILYVAYSLLMCSNVN